MSTDTGNSATVRHDLTANYDQVKNKLGYGVALGLEERCGPLTVNLNTQTTILKLGHDKHLNLKGLGSTVGSYNA